MGRIVSGEDRNILFFSSLRRLNIVFYCRMTVASRERGRDIVKRSYCGTTGILLYKEHGDAGVVCTFSAWTREEREICIIEYHQALNKTLLFIVLFMSVTQKNCFQSSSTDSRQSFSAIMQLSRRWFLIPPPAFPPQVSDAVRRPRRRCFWGPYRYHSQSLNHGPLASRMTH